MQSFQDEAIVLRKKPLKEKDELVIVLTKQYGKMAFVSYGSRDPKSRKAGMVEQFNTIAFEARQGKTSLPVLQQAKLLSARAFSLLENQQDLEVFYRASEMVGLADQLLHDDQNVQNVYNILGYALDAVAQKGAEIAYQVALLNTLGFLPEWRVCFLCDDALALDQLLLFCTEHRGFAHRDCCQKHTDSRFGLLKEVDNSLLKVMNFWQQQEFRQALRVEVSQQQVFELKELLKGIEVE